jgi:hypothetical protein
LKHPVPKFRLRLVLWLASCAATPALAHHSFAMYDMTQVVTLKGSIKEFQWTNPHVLVWLVNDPADTQPPDLWTIELPTSPGNLTRVGWSKHSLKAGDRVIVEISPLRNGKHGGSFKKATLVDTGEVLIVNIPKPNAASDPPKAEHK